MNSHGIIYKNGWKAGFAYTSQTNNLLTTQALHIDSDNSSVYDGNERNIVNGTQDDNHSSTRKFPNITKSKSSSAKDSKTTKTSKVKDEENKIPDNDVVVKYILAIVAGIFVFGIIFTQIGFTLA